MQIAHVAKTRLIYCFSGSQLAGSKIYLLLLDLGIIRAIYKPVNVISYFNHSTMYTLHSQLSYTLCVEIVKWVCHELHNDLQYCWRLHLDFCTEQGFNSSFFVHSAA